MPSHKTTKKSSSNRSSEEKNSKDFDIKPLSFYVDDRVELIRQAFICLKAKTIKNVTPEFLKGKSIDKLQEICLDEVLGISKKRLISLINDTKCPTDTESSSSDSDAPKVIEDHISLSEISSDDNMFDDARNKKKVKKVEKKEKKPDIKKLKNGEGTSKAGGRAGMSEKEVTVLELLELQARARAIRSQLALEPVTKIELDSDESGNEKIVNEKDKSKPKKAVTPQKQPVAVESSSKSKEKVIPKEVSKDKHASSSEDHHKKKKKHKDDLKQRSRSRNRSLSPEKLPDLRTKLEKRRTESQTSNASGNNVKSIINIGQVTPSEEQSTRRRVVLKRNFNENVGNITETSTQVIANSNKKEATTKQKTPEKEKPSVGTTADSIKKEKNESDRESSPDVIAMHPSPETILLTSSDEEMVKSQKTKQHTEVIKTPVENNSLKTSDSNQAKQKPSPRKNIISPVKNTATKQQPIRDRSPGVLSLEAEELDYDEKMSDSDPGPSQKKTPEKLNKKSTTATNTCGSESGDDWENSIHHDYESDKLGESSQKTETLTSQEPIKDSPDSPEEADRSGKKDNVTTVVVNEPEKVKQEAVILEIESSQTEKQEETIDVENIQSDISLSESSDGSSSGDSSSDSEVVQQSQKTSLDSLSTVKYKSDTDVVCIDMNESSDDGGLNEEQNEDQSWGQRWLRSRKVTNVMANAKLGNKIRGKIKEKKIEEKKAAVEQVRVEKLKREKVQEEIRKKKEEEKKAAEVPDEILGTTKHFKDLKLLGLLKEEREKRKARETARKKK